MFTRSNTIMRPNFNRRIITNLKICVKNREPLDAICYDMWAPNVRSKPLNLFGRLEIIVVNFQDLIPYGSQDICKIKIIVDVLC